MTVDIARAAVITGDGVVARFPGVLCVARCGDRDVLLKLLDVCAGVSGPDPGRALARRLAKWMGGPDAPGDDLEFGTVATAGSQLGVFLVGSVDVAVPGSPVALSGSDAATWTDRLISVPGAPVLLALDGARPPAGLADGVNDLRAGVVPGAGAVLFPAGRAAAPRPDAAAGSVLDGPTIRTPAHGGAVPARAAVAPEVAVPGGPAANGTVHSGTGPNGVVRNGSPRNGSPADADTRRPRPADPRTPNGYEWFADWSGADPGPAPAGPGPAGPGSWPWTESPADRGPARPDDRPATSEEALAGRPEDSRPDLAPAASPGRAEEAPPDRADAGRPGRGQEGPFDRADTARFGGAAEGPLDRADAGRPGRGLEGPSDRVDAGWPGRADAGRGGRADRDRPDAGRVDAGPWAEPPTPPGGAARTADERPQVWIDPAEPTAHADPADQLQEGRHAIAGPGDAEAVAAPGEQDAALPAPVEETGYHDVTAAGAPRYGGADDATPVNAVAAVEPVAVAVDGPAAPRPAPEDGVPGDPAGRRPDDGLREDGVPDDGPSGGAVPDERDPDVEPAPQEARTPTPAPRPHDHTAPGDVPADEDEPLLRGLLCEDGHLNDPRASSCVACGAPVEPGEDVVGPRPPLGRIVFDDGATFTVDAEYLVGRMPEADPRARSGELQPIVVEDRSGSVSRVHAEILINGWDVVLVDSGSRNGTFVAGPDDSGWTPLAPGRTSLLLPGTRVRMGGRTFVFEPPVAV